MHKSRLGCIVIDCEGDTYEDAIAFWSGVLGAKVSERDDQYTRLQSSNDEMVVLLQRVNHPSRVHLDVESDDIDAEVERLERLGARRIEQLKGWWVMEAPSGHRFCVVKPQRPAFERNATAW